jgi:hypothetical protein
VTSRGKHTKKNFGSFFKSEGREKLLRSFVDIHIADSQIADSQTGFIISPPYH